MLVILPFLMTLLLAVLWAIQSTTRPSGGGFFSFYRGLPPSEQDILEVQSADRSNIALFEQTDIDVVPAFLSVIPEKPYVTAYVVANNPLLHITALMLKLYYNRKRPYQVIRQDDDNTRPSSFPRSKTSRTPSYPSSHALQAYALEKHLSKAYPKHAEAISAMAERVSNARIVGGVHYPSDKEFARHLAAVLPWL